MELVSYKSYGDFEFSDTFEIVEKKASSKKHYVGEQEFLGKTNKIIFLENEETSIVFKEEKNQINFFEVSGRNFIHLGKNLFNLNYNDLLQLYSQLDEKIIIKDDGFETKKFGIGIYRKLKDAKYTNSVESIIAFCDDYTQESEPSADDIINFYLNNTED